MMVGERTQLQLDLFPDMSGSGFSIKGHFPGNRGEVELKFERMDDALEKPKLNDDPSASNFITNFPAPEGWEEHLINYGYIYFHNSNSKERTSALLKPRKFDSNGLLLPNWWIPNLDRSKNREVAKVYYHNSQTGKSQDCTPLYQGEAVKHWALGSGPSSDDYQHFETSAECIEKSWLENLGLKSRSRHSFSAGL